MSKFLEWVMPSVLVQGEALSSAKKVVLLLLHHLPPKTLFNIVTFGAGQRSGCTVQHYSSNP